MLACYCCSESLWNWLLVDWGLIMDAGTFSLACSVLGVYRSFYFLSLDLLRVDDTDLLRAEVWREPFPAVLSLIDAVDCLNELDAFSSELALAYLLNMTEPLNCLGLPWAGSPLLVYLCGLLDTYRLILLYQLQTKGYQLC